jgi:hypothetical protein
VGNRAGVEVFREEKASWVVGIRAPDVNSAARRYTGYAIPAPLTVTNMTAS